MGIVLDILIALLIFVTIVWWYGMRSGKIVGWEQKIKMSKWCKQVRFKSVIYRKEQIRRLYPLEMGTEREQEFFKKRIRNMYLLACVGIVVISIQYYGQKSCDWEATQQIRRNEPGLLAKDITLRACDMGGNELLETTLNLRERSYSNSEIEELFERFQNEIEKLILGDNESLERVTADLLLQSGYEGYPFTVSWGSSESSKLTIDGKCRNKDETKDIPVILTANIQYKDFQRSIELPVQLITPFDSDEKMQKRELQQLLVEAEEHQQVESVLQLPQEWKGKNIHWTEVKTDHTGILLILLGATIIGMWRGMDIDITKEVKKRNEQMQSDYPGLVMKLSLYLGAGLSISEAMRRISCKNRERYAVQEIMILIQELDRGIGEYKAIENWGGRCGIPSYKKLSNLLVQGMKKGGNNLIVRMDAEAELAFEQRKQRARKLGEEAGTKLLLPMLLLLLVVMIMILIPAFKGFMG